MNKIFSFLLIIGIPLVSLGQERAIPISISVFNEATAIPFTRFITTPIHPGLQLGTEFNYKKKEHTRLFQTANLSYFYHSHLSQGIAVFTELGYEFRINSGFAFTGLFGLGYMQTFATNVEYTFTDGQYVERVDRGNARLFPSLSLDIGYYLLKASPNSPKIFLRYQSWMEYPYSPGFIPAMTHINLHIGVKFYITTNHKKQ